MGSRLGFGSGAFLHIDVTAVTDAGLLEPPASQVMAAGVAELKKALPKCKRAEYPEDSARLTGRA